MTCRAAAARAASASPVPFCLVQLSLPVKLNHVHGWNASSHKTACSWQGTRVAWAGWAPLRLCLPTRRVEPPHHPTSGMVKVTDSQRKRAKLFILLLQGSAVDAAIKKLKIKNKSYVSKLISHLGETSSLADAPRSGRPEKYSSDVLSKAKDFLLGLEDAAFCCKDVVAAMIDEDVIPEDTPWASFWPKFIKYLSSQEIYLVWGIQRLTFAMNKRHVKARLQWCHENKLIFTDRTMKQFWFTDEISLEYGGHPKGECNKCGLEGAGASKLVKLTCPAQDSMVSGQCFLANKTLPLTTHAGSISRACLLRSARAAWVCRAARPAAVE